MTRKWCGTCDYMQKPNGSTYQCNDTNWVVGPDHFRAKEVRMCRAVCSYSKMPYWMGVVDMGRTARMLCLPESAEAEIDARKPGFKDGPLPGETCRCWKSKAAQDD